MAQSHLTRRETAQNRLIHSGEMRGGEGHRRNIIVHRADGWVMVLSTCYGCARSRLRISLEGETGVGMFVRISDQERSSDLRRLKRKLPPVHAAFHRICRRLNVPLEIKVKLCLALGDRRLETRAA